MVWMVKKTMAKSVSQVHDSHIYFAASFRGKTLGGSRGKPWKASFNIHFFIFGL
jgi:hypothetical protein